jgi:hypothetical protein
LPLTNATLWAALLALAGVWWAALADPSQGPCGVGGLFGSTVAWRDARLRLDQERRIVEIAGAEAQTAQKTAPKS